MILNNFTRQIISLKLSIILFLLLHELIPCIVDLNRSSNVFMQFSWRPRPPSSLSTEKEEEIEKNLKTYSYKYEAEDQDTLMFFNERERQRRKILMEEWSRRILEWKHLREEQKTQRSMLRDEEASEVEDGYTVKEVELEVVIHVAKEVFVFFILMIQHDVW